VNDATTQPVSSASRGIRISDTTTRGIRVQVESAYVPDRSNPKEGSYFFVYHVRISDAEGEVERVKGPGVVGEQPVLQPGGGFEYTSFCPLKTSVGSMHGSYQMVTSDGEPFEAVISPFTLATPNALN
jgi:ApaG protein